ncbi:phosphatidylinositol 3,4,5-trisphosphate 3-phosphatase and protein-tyrosine-phosphatase PTEN2A-like [Rutidosis leptorrhynchoides]|uniref:phosphatidylinositol 3,4,5-trisphosphate 3-phosphatase and protein-tyrosine-phosphatase PTEN2A-like n=1 Tax=Rutidosis leptorrhynchoides TaxID=125765 RepID=UPI003A99C5C0
MDLESAKTTSPSVKESDLQATAVEPGHDSAQGSPSKLSASGITTWAKNLKLSQPLGGTQDDSSSENGGRSPFARLTSGLGLRLSPKSHQQDDSTDGAPTTPQGGIIGTLTKGFVDTSKNAVKAVQVKARHVVSQNKRRYQEGGFDLDMTYITENIIAMGFPAGDMSSGFFGYVEGFYRNHMEEVIRFFETYHKDKYKVYNLCSERLYDASLFEGKVASFPFDDHNCPPIQLIISFCQSAYSWLKQDIENVVVVHCKAGMARTGLMISSLLLYLKFFPTAEESISYYNQKRCVDGKGLILPSQIRYVKYFERILTYFNGEDQPGRRCMLRGIRLHRCPYWIRPSITISDHNGVLFSTKTHPRTKDLSPEDFWFSAPRKGVMVFALPGEPGVTELSGDFKIHFHDRQGDFYCWLNTTMIENRKILTTNDLDGFDKRKLPSPGFQVEVVVVDYDNASQPKPDTDSIAKSTEGSSGNSPPPGASEAISTNMPKDSKSNEKDDEVFSDTESEAKTDTASETNSTSGRIANLSNDTKNLSLGNSGSTQISSTDVLKTDGANSIGVVSDFKAMAADTSVFTFGDDEDYESDENV